MKMFDWFRSGFTVLILAATGVCLLSAQEKTSGPWVMQSSGTAAKLRGIHAVGGGVAWASGSEGTVLRTEDSGYMWQRCAMPPGAEKLDFRGIWAWDADTAIVMSSGLGDLSRIYKTTDGCSHWKLLFTNPDKDGFWDAMQCSNRNTCLLLGDPVRGDLYFWHLSIRRQPPLFPLYASIDGGAKWHRVDDRNLYSMNDSKRGWNESAFAASNTSLLVMTPRWEILFVTGGSKDSLHYIQYSKGSIPMVCKGPCYLASSTPLGLASGVTAGGFSVAANVDDPAHPVIVAVGGDYKLADVSTGSAAVCRGAAVGIFHRYQCQAASVPPHGYRSAVAWDADAKAWIAAGTNGSDISYDDGKTWSPLDDGNWNALSLPWVVGPDGRIAKLDAAKLPKH